MLVWLIINYNANRGLPPDVLRSAHAQHSVAGAASALRASMPGRCCVSCHRGVCAKRLVIKGGVGRGEQLVCGEAIRSRKVKGRGVIGGSCHVQQAEADLLSRVIGEGGQRVFNE